MTVITTRNISFSSLNNLDYSSLSGRRFALLPFVDLLAC